MVQKLFPPSLCSDGMLLCLPPKIARACFANILHKDFLFAIFCNLKSQRAKQMLCFLPPAEYPSFGLLLSRDITRIFLFCWVQLVALMGLDSIILCPTHATLCFNFRTIAHACSILRSSSSSRACFSVFHYICNFSVGSQLQISWTVSAGFL